MKISLICEAAPIAGRLNEDACFVYSDAETVTAASIDGATQRIDVPALYVQASYAPDQTGAYIAAQTTKQTMLRNIHRDPATMILSANTELRQRLERVSPLTAADLAQLAPEHAAMLNDDPRLIRLMLPVCVATVVKLDLINLKASFAHVGDTALYVFHKDGRVSQVTADQMGQHDDIAIQAALAVKAESNAPHLVDVVKHERVTTINKRNGIYHNYVDTNGAPDTTVGVGVINGLPQIEAYLQTGVINLDTVAGLVVCSDGFPLPSPWNETPEQGEQRLSTMRDVLFSEGIEGYFAYLRSIEANDPNLDRYPRFKCQDDVSGVFVALDHYKS